MASADPRVARNDRELVADSRFPSLVLRHAPGRIGLALDAAGWADVDALVDADRAHGRPLGPGRIREIVERNDRQRFAFDPTGQRIRAVQGHSVDIDLGLPPSLPPDVLYYGTATRNLAAIRVGGLVRGRRRHVHLSATPESAHAVGARHGTPAVLVVRAAALNATGHVLHRAENGVWLTARVPVEYLEFPAMPVGG